MTDCHYYDSAEGSHHKISLNSSEELDRVVALVRRMPSPRGVPAIELQGSDGSSLVVGLSDDRAILSYGDSLDNTYHSIAQDDTAAGIISFDHFGTYTEMPTEYSIPVMKRWRLHTGT